MTYSTNVVYNSDTDKYDLTITFNGKEYTKSFDGLGDAGKYCNDFYIENVAAEETDNSDDCPDLI
jgi:hypothetical protein